MKREKPCCFKPNDKAPLLQLSSVRCHLTHTNNTDTDTHNTPQSIITSESVTCLADNAGGKNPLVLPEKRRVRVSLLRAMHSRTYSRRLQALTS